ncbi:DUF2076 domain-containing protein [Azospirillum picis]|uniref:DUF2076 domain-containing protein n=1 Tax=Azospirillum picis TaxID=488438 RepID=A0ABU0MP11_9PROT|nr:DUF2076 domain-containing protein [Azospirillum picis]MBP2301379.1 hypothetical protein [Azospirillum picis]MDQ0535210.1 hypothetical protein [Azospirillum picis]
MTPEERTLLSDLFRRLREVESQPRDGEAEDFIRRSVQDQPLASYYMAQTVLVQQQALSAAQGRIEELERELQAARGRPAAPAASGGSFLSNALGLGRSPWRGGGPSASPPPEPAGRSPWGSPPPAQAGGGFGQPQGTYPQQPYPPAYPPQGMAPRGGGFFAGAAQTAAGVAGGMLAASAISSLLHHSPGPFGSAMAGTPAGETINETVINNYYGDDQAPAPDFDARDVTYNEPDPPQADDASYDDGGSFDDGGGGSGDDSWI